MLIVSKGRVMQMANVSDESKALFRSAIPDAPGVEVNPIFGRLGAFVNGNMFAGLFGASIGVKLLDGVSQRESAAIDGTGAFGPVDRPRGGYITFPPHWTGEPDRMTEWIGLALEHVSGLPSKARQPRKAA